MILQGQGLEPTTPREILAKNQADEQDIHTPSSRKKIHGWENSL